MISLSLAALLVAPPRPDADGIPLPPGVVCRIGSARFRVGEPLSTVRFTPDGSAVLGATTRDPGLVCWDAATGRPRWRKSHYDLSGGAHFTPESVGVRGGEALVLVTTSGGQRSVARFDLATGAETARVPLAGAVRWASDGYFSPDGARVYVAVPRRFAVYDSLTGAVTCGRGSDYNAYSYGGSGWSDDGKRYVEADRTGQVIVSDAATGKEVGRFRPGGRATVTARLSPDGKAVAVMSRNANRGPVRLFAAETGVELAKLPAGDARLSPRDLVFLSGGKEVAVVGGAGPLTVWDAATGKELRRVAGRGYPSALAFAPGGKTFAVGHAYTVDLHDAATGQRLPQSADDPETAEDLRFLPDGTLMVNRAGLAVFDPLTGTPRRKVLTPDGSGYWASKLSPDGTRAAQFAKGSVRAWDVAADPPRPLGPAAESDGSYLGVTPAGGLLLGGQRADMKWAYGAWDAAKKARVADLGVFPRPVTAAAVSPDGRRAIGACAPAEDAAGAVRYAVEVVVWDVPGNRELARHKVVSEHGPLIAAVSPDGTLAAVADNNLNDDDAGAFTRRPTIYLYALDTGRPLGSLKCPGERVHAVAFDAAGRVLFAGGEDKIIRLWEVATRKERGSFGTRGQVTAVAASADGRLVASASPDGPVFVWNVYGTAAGSPQAADLSAAWADLLSADAAAAFRAVKALAAGGDRSVSLIRAKLPPAGPLDEAQVGRWVADLDAPAFAAREAASKALAGVAAEVGPLLAAAELSSSAEVKARLAALRPLADTPAGELLRGLRAVEALAAANTPAAKAALRELAAGAPNRRLTAAAKAAVR